MDREQLLEHIRRFLSAIDAEEGYLFGSRARGDYLENSDVDLLIISDKFEGITFPWRLVHLQEHWDLPLFLEALPYTRKEVTMLRPTSGVVAQALGSGIHVYPKAQKERVLAQPIKE